MENPIYPSLIPQADLDIKEHEHWCGLWNEQLCTSIEEKLTEAQREWLSSTPSQRLRILPGVQDLYKYRSFDEEHTERTVGVLREHKLWAASLHSLNDPMEAGYRGPEDEMEAMGAFSFVYLMRSQWSGCVSFSIDPVSKLMWSHYSRDHTGFCIKYRRQDSFLLSSAYCKPVLYRNSMPKLALNDLNRLQSLVDLVFWTKSEAWEYEREWRLRYPRADAYTRSGLLKPYGVIFGLKTRPDVRQFIRNCATGVRFGQMNVGAQDYRLKVVWEEDESSNEDSPQQPDLIHLSELFQKTMDLAIDIAKLQLEEVGEFNPFGLVVYRGEAHVLMIDNAEIASEGIRGNQIERRVEDMIRQLRTKERLEFAAIVSDVNVRPIEGGPSQSAIEGRLEECHGQAMQFIQYYQLVSKNVQLGERTLNRKEHHLLPE